MDRLDTADSAPPHRRSSVLATRRNSVGITTLQDSRRDSRPQTYGIDLLHFGRRRHAGHEAKQSAYISRQPRCGRTAAFALWLRAYRCSALRWLCRCLSLAMPWLSAQASLNSVGRGDRDLGTKNDACRRDEHESLAARHSRRYNRPVSLLPKSALSCINIALFWRHFGVQYLVGNFRANPSFYSLALRSCLREEALPRAKIPRSISAISLHGKKIPLSRGESPTTKGLPLVSKLIPLMTRSERARNSSVVSGRDTDPFRARNNAPSNQRFSTQKHPGRTKTFLNSFTKYWPCHVTHQGICTTKGTVRICPDS